MQTSLASSALAPGSTSTIAKPNSLSFTTLLLALGATSIVIGVLWDISWHQTIGRDTFWTPAHMAIYLGGALGGLMGGWLAISTTYFRPKSERKRSVRLWGGYAPFGAWIAIWGSVAMITSAPFDNWWHNAYGLDVKIISPPHVVLFIGMFSVVGGTLLLALRDQNAGAAGADHLFVYVAGVMVGLIAIHFTNSTWPNLQHSARFAQTAAMVFPVVLVAAARASRLPWAATRVAFVYMFLRCAMVWILPLFSAHPMLGPILTPVDHMVPPSFPLLLIAPALVLDYIARKRGFGRSWSYDLVTAAILGVAFVVVLLPVHWEFARFLLAPSSRNAFFAGDHYWSYNSSTTGRRYIFWADEDAFAPSTLALSVFSAAVSSLVGLGWGRWMTQVKR